VLSDGNRGLQGLSGGNRGLNRTQQQQITPSQGKHRTLQGNSRQQNEQRENNHHIVQGNLTQNEKRGQMNPQKPQGNLTQNKTQKIAKISTITGNSQSDQNDKNQNRHWHHGKHKKHHPLKHHIRSSCLFFGYFSYYPYRYYSHRSYSYPYVSYSLMYSYGSSGYSSSPVYSQEKNEYPTGRIYGIDSAGWTVLAQGEFQTALDIFAKDAEYFPNAGIPKVGYAIAAAAAGDLMQSVIAMREAFHIDPDSIHYLQFDDKVLAIINDLIDIFEDSLQENAKQPDEAFMLSALNYLKHDYGSAHEAIGRAIMDGDNSPSVYNLHVLIDEELTDEYAGEYN